MSDEVREAIERLLTELTEHVDCTWEQVGPCVWCSDHNLRLYQGTLPEERRKSGGRYV